MSRVTRRDGSTTVRYPTGTSTTYDSRGNVRERTRHTTELPFGMGRKITETIDGNGRVMNRQNGWGRK